MLKADLIIPRLAATSKKQVFRAISEEAAKLFHAHPDELLHALVERERIGTTGIGFGVAIPHVKVPHVKKLYGVLARLEPAIDYGAIDAQAVDIIFMLLAPADSKTTQHLKTLAQASRFLKEESVRENIRSATSCEDIAGLLEDWVKKQAA